MTTLRITPHELGLIDDTTPQARLVLTHVYREMTPELKAKVVSDMRQLARQLFDAGYRVRHPEESTDDELVLAWMACKLEPELYEKAQSAFIMSAVYDAWNEVRKTARVLDRMQIPYVLSGSLASSVHGSPRSTNDADIMVAPFPGREAEFAAEFGPGYYVSLPAIVDANRRRASFNIISTLIGFKIDLFVQKERAFDASAMARREARYLPHGATESTAVLTVEDSILTKLEWYRLGGESSDRQWRDVIEMLEVQGQRVDRSYLATWAKELQVNDLLEAAFGQAIIT